MTALAEDFQVVELTFGSHEATKLIDLLDWANKLPDSKIVEKTFRADTLEGIIESMKEAEEKGYGLSYSVRLNCRTLETAAYARLRWGYQS